MNRKTLPAAAAMLAACVSITSAGQLPDGVADDALWFAHADLQALRRTHVGSQLMDALHEGEVDHKLAALSAILNFDPRGDLHDLVVYGFGRDGDGVAIVRGAFDAERLVTLVKAAGGYRTEEYGDHTVHTWIDKQKSPEGKRSIGCIHADDTVVFADHLDVLKRALDVLDGRAPSLMAASRFPGLAERGDHAFLFAAADLSAMDGVHPQAAAFKAVDSLVLSVGESGEDVYALAAMQTPDEETAAIISKILEGMTALAMLGAEQNPVAARLAQGSVIEQVDEHITVTLRLPVTDVIAHLKKREP